MDLSSKICKIIISIYLISGILNYLFKEYLNKNIKYIGVDGSNTGFQVKYKI